jgi:hypothetical protein
MNGFSQHTLMPLKQIFDDVCRNYLQTTVFISSYKLISL